MAWISFVLFGSYSRFTTWATLGSNADYTLICFGIFGSLLLFYKWAILHHCLKWPRSVCYLGLVLNLYSLTGPMVKNKYCTMPWSVNCCLPDDFSFPTKSRPWIAADDALNLLYVQHICSSVKLWIGVKDEVDHLVNLLQEMRAGE